mmetsp:Transcript_77505/g.194905  ORF Transcript_77505/g.194905 Transcript_77505/m.194905 type:complete len:238 (-) Transcript_77505:69-782(-)
MPRCLQVSWGRRLCGGDAFRHLCRLPTSKELEAKEKLRVSIAALAANLRDSHRGQRNAAHCHFDGPTTASCTSLGQGNLQLPHPIASGEVCQKRFQSHPLVGICGKAGQLSSLQAKTAVLGDTITPEQQKVKVRRGNLHNTAGIACAAGIEDPIQHALESPSPRINFLSLKLGGPMRPLCLQVCIILTALVLVSEDVDVCADQKHAEALEPGRCTQGTDCIMAGQETHTDVDWHHDR